ncbi:MAG TPA: FtsX-like permease family protein [Chitinophagales bacterium]|nr:FtsX-like permease family protein [Chitinophagales bacterium]
MNPELFIVRKIAFSSSKSFSSFIIRIAVAAVALSLSTMIITTSMVNGFQKEIRNKVLSFWSHLEIVPFSLSSSLQEEGIYRYQDFYTDKKILPEAKHIQVTALKGGLLKTNDEFEGIVLKGVADDFAWDNMLPYLKQGNKIDIGSDKSQQQIMVSQATADRLQLKLGDKVIVSFMGNSVRNRPFKVQGIFDTGMEEFDKKYALVDIGVIQDLNGWGKDTVGGFEVFLKQETLFKSRSQSYFLTLFGGLLSEERFEELRRDPLENIGEEVYSRMNNPKLDVQTIKSISPGIFDWLDLQTMNELIILTLMIIVAAINMVTALLILILERTNMIGIMKALGSSNVSIRRIFLYYSAAIIGVGLLAGNVFGLGVCLIQKYFHLITLPQESYYLTYAPVEISWGWILSLNIGTIAFTLLLLIIPSMLVSRISPVKAIRFE